MRVRCQLIERDEVCIYAGINCPLSQFSTPNAHGPFWTSRGTAHNTRQPETSHWRLFSFQISRWRLHGLELSQACCVALSLSVQAVSASCLGCERLPYRVPAILALRDHYNRYSQGTTFQRQSTACRLEVLSHKLDGVSRIGCNVVCDWVGPPALSATPTTLLSVVAAKGCDSVARTIGNSGSTNRID